MLFFYRRVFPFKGFRICSILVGAVSVAWFIAYVFIEFFSCRPFQYWFDKTIKGGYCIDLKMTSYAITTPPDIATNLALLALPLFWLWHLRMEIHKKLAVIGIFILGSLYITPKQVVQANGQSATVGSIVRIPLVVRLNYTDANWTAIDIGLWLSVEQNIGILSACLPAIRPLLRKSFFSRLTGCFGRFKQKSFLISQRFPGSRQKNSRTKQKMWFDKVAVSTSNGETSNTSEEKIVSTTDQGVKSVTDPELRDIPPLDMRLIDKTDEEWQGARTQHSK